MKKTKVLLVEDNKSLVKMIQEYFQQHSTVEISLVAYDGVEGIRLTEQQEEYDILLLDLIMPQKDGIAVLEHMKAKNINKKVIILTSYNTQDMIRKVSELAVDYFILKPFELEDLEKRILEVAEGVKFGGKEINIYQNNLQLAITKLLHELGIPSHIKGYQYVKESISLVYKEPEASVGITTRLYPEVAKKYNATTSCVERAIRHAIEISWNRGDWDLMEEIFGHSIDIDKAKPTNSEFIITVADKLRLDFSKPLDN